MYDEEFVKKIDEILAISDKDELHYRFDYTKKIRNIIKNRSIDYYKNVPRLLLHELLLYGDRPHPNSRVKALLNELIEVADELYPEN